MCIPCCTVSISGPQTLDGLLDLSSQRQTNIRASSHMKAIMIPFPSTPFAQPAELYGKLFIKSDKTTINRTSPSTKTNLPGQPQVDLHGPEITNFLKKELATPDLNRFHPHLWKVAKQDSTHISSLCDQTVRGRHIIVTENPELHLVWILDRVYIKPIPKFLLSHAFWEFYFASDQSPLKGDRHEVAKAARGFLRSYFYLIQHKSDFAIAQHEYQRLLPKGVRYSQFMRFIMAFESVGDADVSLRYSYGELRLSRLNLWAVFALRRYTFHKTVWQYGPFLAQYYGSILFVFAGFSTVLSAMQVALAVPLASTADSWVAFARMCRVVSVGTCVLVVVVILFLTVAILARGVREVVFAVKDLVKKGRTKDKTSVGNVTP